MSKIVDNGKHPGLGKYEGVVEQRHTTDPLCFLMIVALWVVMTIVGGIAIKGGDPNLLLSPFDYQGNICGITSGYTNVPYFYSVLTYGAGVCTSKCPTANPPANSINPNDYICLNTIAQYGTTGGTNAALGEFIESACFTAPQAEGGVFNIESNCGCMLIYPTSNEFYRCRFTNTTVANAFATQKLQGYLTSFVADVYDSAGIVFGYGGGAAVLLSLIYIAILRFQCIASTLVWGLGGGIVVMFALLTWTAYATALQWEHANPQVHTNNDIYALRVASVVFITLATIWFLLMVCNAKNIQISIKIMALSSECIEDMPCIFLIPMLKVVGILLFMVSNIICNFFF